MHKDALKHYFVMQRGRMLKHLAMRPPAQIVSDDKWFLATPQARRVENGHTCARGAMPSCAKGRTDRKRSIARRGDGNGGAVVTIFFG